MRAMGLPLVRSEQITSSGGRFFALQELSIGNGGEAVDVHAVVPAKLALKCHRGDEVNHLNLKNDSGETIP